MTATQAWVRQLKFVDAFSTIPATLSAGMSAGLDTEPCAEGGLNLGYIADGATTSLRGVDFGSGGASAVTFRLATPVAGASISVLADGAVVANACAVPVTGDWQVYANVTCTLSTAVTGVVSNLTLLFAGPLNEGLLNLRFLTFVAAAPALAVRALAAIPPPVTVSVALRAMSTSLYLQVSSDPNSDGVISPSGAAGAPLDPSLLFVLVDNEDGTWSLQAAPGSPAEGLFVCATLSGEGPLCANAAAVSDPCTRFWLYGTTFGTCALLSAANGQFVVSGASDEPLMPTAADPRGVPADGARFWIEQQQPVALAAALR